jgi:hypothetical protein
MCRLRRTWVSTSLSGTQARQVHCEGRACRAATTWGCEGHMASFRRATARSALSYRLPDVPRRVMLGSDGASGYTGPTRTNRRLASLRSEQDLLE